MNNALANILLRITGDADDAKRELSEAGREVAEFGAKSGEAKITVDNSRALDAVRDASRELLDFAKRSGEADATVDASEAERRLNDLRAELQRLDTSNADVKAQADVTKAMFDLDRLLAKVKELDGQDVDIDVNRGILERMASLSGRVDVLGRSLETAADSGQGLTDTIRDGALALVGRAGIGTAANVAIGALLIPLIASAAGGVFALVTVLVNAALGLGALGVAAAGALGPIGGLVLGVIQRFSEFKDEAGTAANRAKQAFDSFGNTLKDTLAPAADAVLDGIAEGAQTLEPAVGKLDGKFANLGQSIGKALGGLAEQLASKSMVNGLKGLIDGAAQLAGPIARGIGSLLEIFTKIANAAMPTLVDVAKDAAKWLGNVADSIKVGDAKDVIGDLVSDLDKVVDFGKQAARAVGALFEGARGPGRELLEVITDIAKDFANFAETAEGKSAIADFFKNASLVAQAFIGTIRDLIGFVGDFVGSLNNMAADFVGVGANILGTLADIIDGFNALPGPDIDTSGLREGEQALRDLQTGLENIDTKPVTQELEGLAKGTGKAGKSMGDALAKGLKDTKNKARDGGRDLGDEAAKGGEDKKRDNESAGKHLGDAVKEGLRSMQNEVRGKGRDLGDEAKGGAEDRKSAAKNAGDAIGAAIRDGVDSRKGDAKDAGKNVASSASEGASGAPGAEAAGRNISAGIAAGIEAGANAAINAAVKVVGDAIAAANRKADSKSPSREFAKIGGYLSQGLAVGILEDAPQAIAAMEATVGAILGDGSRQIVAGVGLKVNGAGVGLDRVSDSLAAVLARPTVVQNNSMLHPADPTVLRAVGDASVRGIGLQPSRPRKRVSV